MTREKSPLEVQIRTLVGERGPITFAEYMSHALYDEALGYYRSTRNVVGRGGDFYTSVSATPLFARLLLQAMDHYDRHHWGQALATADREVHEFGAHRGQLRADMLAAAPDLTYHTYESRDVWPERLSGCVIANELLDALPFHRVEVVERRWRELYVGVVDDVLSWVPGELSTPELLEPLEGLPLEYMEGYTTEVCLEARRWLRTLARRLESGLVFLFDYGHETETYFAPHRAEGGLRTFKRHERGADPFIDVGERDITCDVNFSDVLSTAEKAGFEVLDFVEQGRFFSRQVALLLRQHSSSGPGGNGGSADLASSAPFAGTSGVFSPEEVRGLMTLTHPAHLGMAFKVTVLRKTPPGTP